MQVMASITQPRLLRFDHYPQPLDCFQSQLTLLWPQVEAENVFVRPYHTPSSVCTCTDYNRHTDNAHILPTCTGWNWHSYIIHAPQEDCFLQLVTSHRQPLAVLTPTCLSVAHFAIFTTFFGKVCQKIIQ